MGRNRSGSDSAAMRRGGHALATVLLCAVAAVLSGQRAAGAEGVVGEVDGRSSRPGAGAMVFRDVTSAAGIEFVHTIGDTELSNIIEATGVGCGFLDYDGDGWLDIYLVNGCWQAGVSDDGLEERVRERLARATDRLYRNRGDGTFEDVTERAGLSRPGYGMGVVAADYDGDGDTDIYVTNYGPNFLWRNNGDGTFSEVGKEAGVADAGFSVGAVFLDYDRDGVLDLYVGNYLEYDAEYRHYYAPDGFPGPLAYVGQQDRLYRGKGDGTFEEVTERAGVVIRPAGRAMGVGAFDYDGDGWVDIFVANDAMENFLLRNRGDGRYENRAWDAGVAFGEAGEATAAMGVEVGDYDEDGRWDVFIPDMTYCSLYRAVGEGMYEDYSARSGLAALMGQYVSWGAVMADFDLDGHLDLYICNGDLHHLEGQEDVLVQGDGRGRFRDVSAGAGPWFREKRVGRGAAAGDYDNDGDVDLLVANLNERPVLLRNDTPRLGRHWLEVRLEGRAPNRDALGAVVRVRAGGREQQRCRRSAGSYLSQHDERLHFGLGEAPEIEGLEVVWPDGSVEQFGSMPADRVITIRQGRGEK